MCTSRRGMTLVGPRGHGQSAAWVFGTSLVFTVVCGLGVWFLSWCFGFCFLHVYLIVHQGKGQAHFLVTHLWVTLKKAH